MENADCRTRKASKRLSLIWKQRKVKDTPVTVKNRKRTLCQVMLYIKLVTDGQRKQQSGNPRNVGDRKGRELGGEGKLEPLPEQEELH